MANDTGWQHPIDDSDQWDGFNEPGIEHFAGNPVRHLAREVNQNSGDAADNNKCVVVKMSHLVVETSTIPNVKQLERTIALCKKAAKKESERAHTFFTVAEQELKKKKISVLQISDYNTTGMKGPCQNGTPFFAFMKAKGQSRKLSDTATGSFGIGKFAPYAASKLRTVFVSTVYRDAGGAYRQLTQGKSILMSHDDASKRRQGAGFWGITERCQPIQGISKNLPSYIQRANSPATLKKSIGTTLTILGFDASPGWKENLAASVAENFFGAIQAKHLEVDINGEYSLNADTIKDFFDNSHIRTAIQTHKNEPDQFDNSKNYYNALTSDVAIVEQTQHLHLGLCELRILVADGLPKKVCFLRNGMLISDSLSLPGIRGFSEFKDFVAVVECKHPQGIELLRAMEPPRHDDFEPDRLPTKEQQRKGDKSLKDLAAWIREMLKRHAKDPVSEVTSLDELEEYFADDSSSGNGRSSDEIDPTAPLKVFAKPVKLKGIRLSKSDADGDAGEGEGGEGGGGDEGEGGGDGTGGKGEGSGGSGGGAKPKNEVPISNVRAVVAGSNLRNVSLTPGHTGKVSIKVLEAGADSDYGVAITGSNIGKITDGAVLLNAVTGKRITLQLRLDTTFGGALKVVAHEV